MGLVSVIPGLPVPVKSERLLLHAIPLRISLLSFADVVSSEKFCPQIHIHFAAF